MALTSAPLDDMTTNIAQPPAGGRLGLSGKLLGLTVAFVMLAEVLIFVPSIANFRLNFIDDQLNRARTAALALDAAPEGAVAEPLARRLLKSVGATALVLKTGGSRRLLAVSDMPSEVGVTVDRREAVGPSAVLDALDALLNGHKRLARIVDAAAPNQGDFIEIVVDETQLRNAMLAFAGKVLLISLLISVLTAALVYLALDRIIVRPVRRLTASMTGFAGAPEDASRIVVASGRADEIGVAEVELARMQTEIHDQLQQKSRLAALGLAVSKINHDLRNLLAAAQLMSDRLGTVADPTVQKLAPKLIATLDRAIAFCQSTLSYGRAQEHPPARRMVAFAEIVEDVRAALGVAPGGKVGLASAVERSLVLDADPEQVFRVLLNLGRNAMQAFEGRSDPDPGRDQIRISGRREGAVVVIEVSDTGPGLPRKAREHMFEPFQGSTRTGGTGLGLAIAAELVRAHGGSITLVDGTIGATFRITVPDRPIDLQARARQRASA